MSPFFNASKTLGELKARQLSLSCLLENVKVEGVELSSELLLINIL
jgi:hypothetical protein